MKTMNFTTIFHLLLLPILLIAGCSQPPVIRHKVNAGHLRSVDQSFLKRANQFEAELRGARIELVNERQKTDLLAVELKLARTGLEAAQLQQTRAKLFFRLKSARIVDGQVKAPTQVDRELELARKYLELAEIDFRHNAKRIELLQWKVLTRTAQLLEEQVLAMFKAQVAVAGKYHKVTYMDQTYRVRRKYLLLEEKLAVMTGAAEALRKQIDVSWNPFFCRSPLVPVPVCEPCEARPEVTPAPVPGPVPPAAGTQVK